MCQASGAQTDRVIAKRAHTYTHTALHAHVLCLYPLAAASCAYFLRYYFVCYLLPMVMKAGTHKHFSSETLQERTDLSLFTKGGMNFILLFFYYFLIACRGSSRHFCQFKAPNVVLTLGAGGRRSCYERRLTH